MVIVVLSPLVRSDERHVKSHLKPAADGYEGNDLTEILIAVLQIVILVLKIDKSQAVEYAVVCVDPALPGGIRRAAGTRTPRFIPSFTEKRPQSQGPPEIASSSEQRLADQAD